MRPLDSSVDDQAHCRAARALLQLPARCPGFRRRSNAKGRLSEPSLRSKYSSNFRLSLLYLRVCHVTCDFTARWFALFAAADPRLPEQRRNK